MREIWRCTYCHFLTKYVKYLRHYHFLECHFLFNNSKIIKMKTFLLASRWQWEKLYVFQLYLLKMGSRMLMIGFNVVFLAALCAETIGMRSSKSNLYTNTKTEGLRSYESVEFPHFRIEKSILIFNVGDTITYVGVSYLLHRTYQLRRT